MMASNNKKDKRFSKLLSTVEKGKVSPDKQFLAQLRDITLNQFENYSPKSENYPQAKTISIWRIIMKSPITKIAVAAVFIMAILVGINHLTGSAGPGSVAFAQVLEHFKASNYTFDLRVDTTQQTQTPTTLQMQAMVWGLGKMRVDCDTGKVGDISVITDFTSARTLLLFHQNRTGIIKSEPVLNHHTGFAAIASFYTKPIENIWNLRDGTEDPLGNKEINGQPVTGFRVFKEDEYFEYEITIWVDQTESIPVKVTAIAEPLKSSHLSIKWVMENFNLDVQLDQQLFSLDVPAGYTLAYQEDLEMFESQTEPSAEAEKIVRLLGLFSDGRTSQAIELLLEVDWTKDITFGTEPYIFSLTEKSYIALKPADQSKAMTQVMAALSVVRQIAQEASARGQIAIANQNYKSAQQHFEAAYQLGRLLSRNPERMIIVRLAGIATQKFSLNGMIELYTATNDQEKLEIAEKLLRTAEAQGDEIKKQATGQ